MNTGGSTFKVLNIAVIDSAPTSLIYATAPAVYSRGVAITSNFPTSSGGAVVSYAINPSLPAGLSFNTASGHITGTPTVAAASTVYTITATNSGGNVSYALTLSVNDIPPVLLAYTFNPVIYTKGNAIAANAPTSSGGAIDSFSVSPGLPAGLAIDLLNGIISGTPTAIAASGTYTITATNTGGNVSTTLTLTVNDIAPAGLTYTAHSNSYTKGVAITSNTPTSTGGAVVSYSVSPTLPAGLSLNTSTGAITGTPSALAASATYTITATNTGGNASRAITISVVDAAPTSLTYLALTPTYLKNSSITANTPSNSGGGITTYSVSPSLPAGLSLNTSTGVISGTPTAVTASATYVITGSNAISSTQASLTILVNDAIPTSLAYGTATAVYPEQTAIAANTPSNSGGAITSYSVAPSLPAGLAINASTGVISGTPTAVQAANNYVVTGTNVSGSANVTVSIRVSTVAVLALAYTDPKFNLTANQAITITPSTLTGGKPTTCSPSMSLPSGLSIDPVTCVISGTPTGTAGSYKANVVTASNTAGSAAANLGIGVRGETKQWMWVSGSSTLNAAPVYGTIGVAANTNDPGARAGSYYGYDKTRKILLMFGGGNNSNERNDLWKWDGESWTWIHGPSTLNQKGIYGTKNVAASSNIPGARKRGTHWMDSQGNLYVYGGTGMDAAGTEGVLNDLWKWDGVNWTWLSGSSTADVDGSYSAVGVVNATNLPHPRIRTASWIDSSGALYLFGGLDNRVSGSSAYLSDLWRWRATDGWVLLSGSATTNLTGNYVTKGTANSAAIPTARENAQYWTDNNGHFFLYGGYRSLGSTGYQYGDLWKWNGTAWTWLSGSDASDVDMVMGTLRVTGSSAHPGSRSGASVAVDSLGRAWLFGGSANAGGSNGRSSNLFMFDGTNWTWMSGGSQLDASYNLGSVGVMSTTVVPLPSSGSYRSVFFFDVNDHLYNANTSYSASNFYCPLLRFIY